MAQTILWMDVWSWRILSDKVHDVINAELCEVVEKCTYRYLKPHHMKYRVYNQDLALLDFVDLPDQFIFVR